MRSCRGRDGKSGLCLPTSALRFGRKVSALQAEVEEQEAKLTQLREVAASIAADVQSAQEKDCLKWPLLALAFRIVFCRPFRQ